MDRPKIKICVAFFVKIWNNKVAKILYKYLYSILYSIL